MSTQNHTDSRVTAQASYPAAATGWYTTILLALLYWLSILDRTIISLLVDPIKADLAISDIQFGMLHGLLALSLGPILIAVFSDYVYGGNAINLGIATMFGSCLPLAAVALIRGRPAIWEAVASAEEWSDENRKLKLEEQ